MRNDPALLRGLVLLLTLATAVSCGGGGTATPTTALDRGAVAAPEVQAAEVGGEILRMGGNAVDAAIAVQFASSVTNAFGVGLGGGGFMLIHDPASPGAGVIALDYRETAPAAAHRDLFLDENGAVDSDLSVFSALASAVPGTVRGMAAAHERFGSLPWAALVQPAIELAENGFLIDPWTAHSFDKYGRKFAAVDERFQALIEFDDYFEGASGDRLKLPELAETLRRIVSEGPDEFYTGRTAELIVEEMERAGGLITAADLVGYRPVWREPVEGSYRGYRIVSMPPPSSGGVVLVELLNMLELFDPLPLHSAEQIHMTAEAAKRVFADRAEYLGDPDFVEVPVQVLVDKAFARTRAEGIDPGRRTDPLTLTAGDLPFGQRGDGQTSHFSIVDRNGLAVSNTTTLNTAYGSGLVVDGAGFLLNSQMDDFSAKPGVPNVYGVTGSEANEIAPGKRPLSSMTPTMLFDPRGDLVLVLGSPGGPTIISAVAEVILHVVDYDRPLAEAVDLPRFHHQWPPPTPGTDPISIETEEPYALHAEVVEALLGYGYTLDERETIGDVQAVGIEGRAVNAVFDRRRTGGVAYY